jgi:hypothetical protein
VRDLALLLSGPGLAEQSGFWLTADSLKIIHILTGIGCCDQ